MRILRVAPAEPDPIRRPARRRLSRCVEEHPATGTRAHEREPDLVYELRSTPVDRSAPPFVISRPNAADASVRADCLLTPDGKSALYRVGLGPGERGSELFHVHLRGNREPTRISLRRPALAETVHGFELAPDGQQVLHRSVHDSPGVIELYAARSARAPRVERR